MLLFLASCGRIHLVKRVVFAVAAPAPEESALGGVN